MITAEHLRDLALQLPLQDRASLARDLLQSLDVADSPGAVEAAWLEEIESRSEAYESGGIVADDWQASIERVREQLREGRIP